MQFIKNNWFWNVILIVTVILCVAILTLHLKNWIGGDSNTIKLRSGFYNVKIAYSELDSVLLVDRVPPMERINGFSALEKEKGIFREFKDSLTDKKVHVFVDNINQQKVKLVYKDSLYLYLNFKDSVETLKLMNGLTTKMNSSINLN
ncbi:hypothetical protein [Maribacter sp. ACAM166]|uniref:hypothetical protein n=1 Tax=Maribacter sp. ACAM166 TaxID=2508996 RepID=UPI0010FDCB13|nr:hypothetical protein [Maribacter sp. ACAM166]TLP71199.1 hypothetical protein ES765_19895 [Maribacter sp. ACAM166]